jgi:hypothetical protein
MPEPCKQDGPVAALTEAVRSIAETSKDMKHLQMETLETLKDLAAQGEQIKALAQRQTKTERDLDEVFPRMRAVEEKGIRHDAFIQQQKEDAERNSTRGTYIKGGLTVSSILAVAAFILYLYAHSGYATRDEQPGVEKVEKTQRR